MTKEILAWLATMAQQYFPNGAGRVLEVGSFNVNGTARTVFHRIADEYIGIDQSPGPGVDLVLSGHDISKRFDPESFDTVICCETLEHDTMFWKTLEQMRIVLKNDGLLIITTPTFGFPIHRYPVDLWRFSNDAYVEVFFEGMSILNIATLDNDAGPQISMAGIARK